MAWYFHIVELDDGRWACRHGSTEYHQHASLEQAVEHMRHVASEQAPGSIIVHRRDGTVDHLPAN
jgi:hypothetical protein